MQGFRGRDRRVSILSTVFNPRYASREDWRDWKEGFCNPKIPPRVTVASYCMRVLIFYQKQGKSWTVICWSNLVRITKRVWKSKIWMSYFSYIVWSLIALFIACVRSALMTLVVFYEKLMPSHTSAACIDSVTSKSSFGTLLRAVLGLILGQHVPVCGSSLWVPEAKGMSFGVGER